MAKLTQEIAGNPIGEGHWTSVQVGMPDPVSRQHTSSMMGSRHMAVDLKQAILEFTSNVLLDNADSMHIGGFGQAGDEPTPGGEGGPDWWGDTTPGWEPETTVDGLNALGKGAPKGGCWNCGDRIVPMIARAREGQRAERSGNRKRER